MTQNSGARRGKVSKPRPYAWVALVVSIVMVLQLGVVAWSGLTARGEALEAATTTLERVGQAREDNVVAFLEAAPSLVERWARQLELKYDQALDVILDDPFFGTSPEEFDPALFPEFGGEEDFFDPESFPALPDFEDLPAVDEASYLDSTLDPLALEANALSELEAYPQLSSVTIATLDGMTVTARRTYDGYESLVNYGGDDPYVALTIYDTAFNVVSVEESSAPQVDVLNEPDHVKALQARETIWGVPVLSPRTNTILVSVSRAARDRNGDAFALIDAKLDLRQLSRYLSVLPIGDDGEAYLADGQGRIIAGSERFISGLFVDDGAGGPLPGQGPDGELGLGVAPLPSASSQGVYLVAANDLVGAEQGVFTDEGGFLANTRALTDIGAKGWVLQIRGTEEGLAGGVSAYQSRLFLYTSVIGVITLLATFLVYRLRKPITVLEARAATDSLTGLGNRHKLDSAGQRSLTAIIDSGSRALLVMADVDNFKTINDEGGHFAGDSVLARLGSEMPHIWPSATLLIRYGGDEFLVLQELGKYEDPADVVERARLQMERKLRFSPRTSAAVGISAGFSVAFDSSRTISQLIDDADLALIRAKGAGKHRSAAAPEAHSSEAAVRRAPEA